MKKRKQREEKKSVPLKYAAQSENGNRSGVGVVAQMNKKKEGESSETKIIGQMGKWRISIPKIGKQREAQGSRSKHLNYHVPGGHVACTAAIMHLIQNKTPRVVDSLGKPFIFYDCHDVS